MKTVQNFEMNASMVCPNEDDMTCMVYVHVDGWDSQKQAYADIEAFADGENDPMGCDIEDELAEMGLELVYPGKLVDDHSIEFEILKIKNIK